MKYRAVIMIISLLFVCFAPSRAQDNGYVYQDSSLLPPDTAYNPLTDVDGTDAADDSLEEEYDADYEVDTSLVSNGLQLSPDSIASLRKSKSFKYAQHLDSLLQQHQLSKAANDPPRKRSASWLGAILSSSFTMYFFWALAVGFLGFILYNLFFTQGFFQRSSARPVISNLAQEPGDQLHATTDYERLVREAVNKSDYRMAIRYLYLQSLQVLMQKKAIDFAPDKTNHEYLAALAGKPYRPLFASVTRHYEYAWYGNFPITEQKFTAVQQQFQQFNKAVI